MSWRLRKQIIYGSILGLIFFLFVLFIYFQLKPQVLPSCFDGKKNQGEEDIDCGGPCPICELKSAQPLKIYPVQFIVYQNTIDIIGLVENPNSNLGLKELNYYFEIYDSNKFLKATTSLKSISLEPETKKYILEINYPKPDFIIGSIKTKIISQAKYWYKTEKEELPVTHYNEKLLTEDNKSKLQLTLFNRSYRPQNVETIVFVYSQDRNLVGIGSVRVSLMPEEAKDVYVFLPEFLIKPAYFDIFLQR
jgi:hypothetical protein